MLFWGMLKDVITIASAITHRAIHLDCVVVDTLNGYVLCHRPKDDTFITWRFEVTIATATFSDGNYDMGRDDARADLIERAYGIALPLDRPVYIVWSSSKAGGATTYPELLRYEETENGAVSSQVQTSDIKSFLEACYNETDIDLCCYEVTPTSTVTVTLTVGEQYDHAAVVAELIHGVSCFDSELFNTLISIK